MKLYPTKHWMPIFAVVVTLSACGDDDPSSQIDASGMAGIGGRPSKGGSGGVSPRAGGTGGAAGRATGKGGSGGAAGSAGKPPNPKPDEPDAGPLPSPMNEIETVAFEQSTKGNPWPNVLFKGGYATNKVELTVSPVDVAMDIQKNPKDWYTWRRTSKGLERRKTAGAEWAPFAYNFQCNASPKGTKLSGTYQYDFISNVSGSGITVSTERTTRYRFLEGGKFESCEARLVVSSSTSPTRSRAQKTGTYEVEGFTLHLLSDDGTKTTLPFFYDGKDMTRLWIEHDYFTALSGAPDICASLPL